MFLINAPAFETVYPQGVIPLHRKVFVTPSDELEAAAQDFAKWDHYCWLMLVKTTDETLPRKDRDWMLDRLQHSGMVFREAIENFAFHTGFARKVSTSLTTQRVADNQKRDALLVERGICPPDPSPTPLLKP